MADQHAEYVLVRRDDLKTVINAADDVSQWSHAEWKARCRLWEALQIDGFAGQPWDQQNWSPGTGPGARIDGPEEA